MRWLGWDAIEGLLLDFSVIDLVLWFPHMTWSEFTYSLAAVIGWNWVSDRIWDEAKAFVRPRIIALIEQFGERGRRFVRR